MDKKDLLNEIKYLPTYEALGGKDDEAGVFVSRRPLDVLDDEEIRNPEGSDIISHQDHLKAIVEEGGVEAKSIASSRYTLEQHEDAFRKVLSYLPEDTVGKVEDYKTKAAMKLYPDGKAEGDIGLWVMNSVDKSAAVRVSFFQVRRDADVHIPKGVLEKSSYKRIHRGEWEEEFEDFLETINQVRSTWKTIVEDLSTRVADEDDIEAIKDIIGKKAATRMDDWLNQKKIDEHTGKAVERNPTVWDLIMHGIKFVSQRLDDSSRVASEVTKEERLRKLSTSLMAYALK